jgi:hypothetical protein
MADKGEPATSDRSCHPHRRHHVGKPRFVITHRKADRSEPAACVIANRWHWPAHGLTRSRRHRWPVAVYHAEGQGDGLEPDQVRDGPALDRPIALVAVTASGLRAAPHDHARRHTLQPQSKTTREGSAGSCRRQTQAQALWA